jgi:hypothetical protein
MTEKNKNILIAFLIVFSLALILALVITLKQTDNIKSQAEANYTKQIETAQSTESSNDDNVLKINAGSEFLKAYYNIGTGTSQVADVSAYSPYCTESLASALAPPASDDEFDDSEINIKYSSGIIIKDVYLNPKDLNELVYNCAVEKQVNGNKSRQAYYITVNVVSENGSYLVSSFDLVPVQRG